MRFLIYTSNSGIIPIVTLKLDSLFSTLVLRYMSVLSICHLLPCWLVLNILKYIFGCSSLSLAIMWHHIELLADTKLLTMSKNLCQRIYVKESSLRSSPAVLIYIVHAGKPNESCTKQAVRKDSCLGPGDGQIAWGPACSFCRSPARSLQDRAVENVDSARTILHM